MMLFAMMLAELDDDDRDFVFQLWEEYGDYMYSTAYDILGSREDAEDAVQEIVLKIMDNLTKFTDRDPDSVKNQIVIYVRCITKNTAIDAYRKNKRRAGHLAENAEDVREVPDFASLPDELVLTRELQDEVRDALRSLPQESRDAVNLFYLEDYSYEEIAAVMGIPVSQVKGRLYRARQKLRTLLEGTL